jgi:hypothetical protein
MWGIEFCWIGICSRLSWLFRLPSYGGILDQNVDGVVFEAQNGAQNGAQNEDQKEDLIINKPILAKPQLALVPVVDHEEPFVMFWYPLHPQIPIQNYYF